MLKDATDMTTGANEDGFHFRQCVSIHRDIGVTALGRLADRAGR